YANGHGPGKAGVYLQIGWLDTTWRPSENAPSSARNQAYQRWVKENPTTGPYLQWIETSDTRADFTATATITKADLDAIARSGATLAVFTVGAGGTIQADNELAVPISFYDTTPSLAVSQTDDLDPAGATITVTGKNYNPDYSYARGVPGFYAQVGWLDANWRPSAGADSSNRSHAYSAWVQGVNSTSPYLAWSINDYGLADFSWTLD